MHINTNIGAADFSAFAFPAGEVTHECLESILSNNASADSRPLLGIMTRLVHFWALVRDFVSNYDELCEYLDSIHSQYRCTAAGTITATSIGVSSKALASAQDSSAGGDARGAGELGVDPAAEVSVSHGRGGMMMQQQKLQGKNRTTVVFKHIHKGCLTYRS